LFGRYHGLGQLSDQIQGQSHIQVARRFSGGRVVPSGDGFVHFSLILPHRSALFSDDPYHLAPFQVLNRYVRGLLHGLKSAGLDAFYPGRDFLTVQQQPIAWISFTTEDNGALLCEGGLAVQRDFSLLPYLLDRIDPNGTVSSQFFTPDQVTSVERITGKAPTLAQLARSIRNGFAQQPQLANLDCLDEALSQTEQEQITQLATCPPAANWLHSWPYRNDLPFHATTTTPLGVLEMRFSVTPEQTLGELQLSGDFIASPAAITMLHHSLRGCPLEYTAVWEVVEQTFLQPQHYVLGLRHLRIIPETILKGYAEKS
jgi:lipoate-protein ligase A